MKRLTLPFIGAAYAVTIYLLTAKTPTVPAVSDYAYYVSMAQGDLGVPVPFNTRILVPFLAGLFGGTEMVFHYMNILLALATCLLMAYHFRDLIAPLFFLLGTAQLRYSLGEPSIDAMIYLLVMVAIITAEWESPLAIPLVSVLAAMTHPVAFVLTSAIFTVYRRPHYTALGIVVFLVLFPAQGSLYLPTVSRMLWGLVYMSFLWAGLFTLGHNRESLRDLVVLACCGGFTILASNVARMLAPAGLVLAPRAVSFFGGLRNEVQDKETHQGQEEEAGQEEVER